jgi:hypothetical protein
MRIIPAIIISLLVSTAIFYMLKFWGLSQPYAPYPHPLLTQSEIIVFKKYPFEKIEQAFLTQENLYLDVANTKDQRVVLVKSGNNNIRGKLYSEVENDVLPLDKFKEQLQQRKIIFNIVENAIAGHLIFTDEIKKLSLEKGENFIITTPYETMAKSIKDLQPTFLFGTSQPENLKLKAMESLYLVEAANIRADIVIYPLKYYKQTFFTDTLIADIKRRHKKFIVGPVKLSEVEEAKKLNPFAIIIEE